MNVKGMCRRGVAAVLAVSLSAGMAVAMPWTAPAQPTGQPSLQNEIAEAQAMMQRSEFEEGAKAFEALSKKAPQNGQVWFGLGYCLHMQGKLDEALPAHLKAGKLGQGVVRSLGLYNAACVYAIKGDKDNAFDMLGKAARSGMRTVNQFETDSDLESLHEDARWKELMADIEEMSRNDPSKALHFWVGSWDCYAKGGKAGTNTLERRVDGAAILEHWTPVQGGVGESWNWYDAGEGVWRQTWVEPNGRYTEFVGKPKDGGIWFEGKVHGSAGVEAKVTMFVRPIEGGLVRQTGGQYDDNGELQPRYDLVYVPKGETFDPAAFAW